MHHRHAGPPPSARDGEWADQFRRAEEVGVTDILTMPWVYHGGFDQPLQQKLDAQADIVVENFSAGVMGRLGLDYTDLAGRITQALPGVTFDPGASIHSLSVEAGPPSYLLRS